MNTITFTPHPDLQKLKADWPEQYDKWKEVLKTSKQGKNKLMKEDGSMCCLGVACHMEGASEESLMLKPLPNPQLEEHAFAKAAANIYIAEATALGKRAADKLDLGSDADPYSPVRNVSASQLNDSFLTHPQISQLLNGETVTMEVPE